MALLKIRIATVRTHAIAAFVALVFDALFWGGPGLLVLVALVGCVLGLVQIVRGLFSERDRILTGALVLASYAVSLLLLAKAIDVHRQGAQARAQQIIRALDAYHAAEGSYPHDLAELIPTYLPSIPRARYTLWMGDYWFSPPVPERHAWLAFTLAPPTGARYFDLETRRWGNAN